MEPTTTPGETVWKGVLVRTLFQSDDLLYTVALLRPSRGGAEPIVVAGNLGGCEVGDSVEVTAVESRHPRHGKQWRVVHARWLPPKTETGIRRYLSGGAVEGIGRTLADRIVDRFGAETLKILDEEPGRLCEVEGIGEARAHAIVESWKRSRQRSEEGVFLASLGLGPVLTSRVVEVLGDEASQTIRRNPYQLVRKVEGIGFKRADEIARRLDVASDAPQRIDAGLWQVLSDEAEQGHLYTGRSELVRRASALLAVAPGPVEDELGRVVEQGGLVEEEGPDGESLLWQPHCWRAERAVAESLLEMLEPREENAGIDAEEALRFAEPRLGITLTADQRRALELLFSHRVAVLTGGPGVGKTTIVKALVDVFLARKLRVQLAAPTGRAARRLEESSGHPASTLHRLLKFHPHTRRFEHGRDLPLEVDVLLVDEASMIDVFLMRSLLEAVPSGARLVLVGDADQLPSVGPGDVLRSVVESGVVPCARLHQILRQREGSTIVYAAHAVLNGEVPAFQREDSEGAFFLPRDVPRAAQRSVLELVTQRLPKRFGLDPRRDIQVLTPMHRGPLGTKELNQALKAALNPSEEGVLAPGDRVLQTKNDYDRTVFNGEIGTVLSVDPVKGTTVVDYEDRRVEYPRAAAAALQPAYCITVHKSQGGEFPAVVLVLSMQHFLLLRRNLLYTALTRARRVLVVVGTERALSKAVEAGVVEHRRSRLTERLAAGLEEQRREASAS